VLSAGSKACAVPGATVLSLDADGQRVLAGLQPFGRSKTALHLVLASAPATGRAAAQHTVALWAEGLRRVLEQEANVSATMKRVTTHEAAL
jgi:hypothetical protein